jgi:uncharacterized zinc-type alcohol dehydrogenase-like protein
VSDSHHVVDLIGEYGDSGYPVYNKEVALAMPVNEAQENEYTEKAWAIPEIGQKFKMIDIPRGKPGDNDVQVRTLYCGITGTDVNFAQNKLGGTMFPLVPGLETVGIVTAVGKNVTKFQPGDLAGIGPISEACMTCEPSKKGDVQFCRNGNVLSCNMMRAHGKIPGNQDNYTMGGFSGSNCLHQDFVVKVPLGISLAEATAFMDVGLTVYDPLKHFLKGRTG